ncbi:MAG: hypothetical protein GX442_21720 [Candidatus Riflebacteria bacterium]|nr:hypothetical protein [Candidatus Riflebacteria bacterium]
MFRKVELPAGVAGELFLCGMPGRGHPLDTFLAEVRAKAVTKIVCLVSPTEVSDSSPAYAKALVTGSLPCPVVSFPIIGWGVPGDREAFVALIDDLACGLERGEHLLVHCLVGRGRTALVAICLLIRLGVLYAEAVALVAIAGSETESPQQVQLVEWYAGQRSQMTGPWGNAGSSFQGRASLDEGTAMAGRTDEKALLDGIQRRIREIQEKRAEYRDITIVIGSEQPPRQPHVGIWWLHQGTVLQVSVEAEACTDPTDPQCVEVEHIHTWPILQKQLSASFSEFLSLGYQDVPRGRVWYHRGFRLYSITCSPIVKADGKALQAIARAFGIQQARYSVVVDPQYPR